MPEINEATGLPEAPEGCHWAVVECNYPVTGTLRVELRQVTQIQVSRVVTEPLPKKWYHIGYTSMARSVVWDTVENYEVLGAESLIDTHTRHIKDGIDPEGAGWELEDPYHTSYINGRGMLSVPTAAPTVHRFYRRHPNTPESVLAAAVKIYDRLEAARERDAQLLREGAERAKLVGTYPPKSLTEVK